MNWLKRYSATVTCLLSLVLMGCGVDATGVVGGGSSVSVAAKLTGADVCLVGQTGIEVVHRPELGIIPVQKLALPETGDVDDPLATLLDLLVSGPTPDERARGLSTEVLTDVRLVVEDISPLVTALDSVPLGGIELAQPLAVTVVSSFLPTEMAAEQIGCTLERYLAQSGIIAQVILYSAGDAVVPRADIGDVDDVAG